MRRPCTRLPRVPRRPYRSRSLILVVAVIALAPAAGCGGDDKPAKRPPPPPASTQETAGVEAPPPAPGPDTSGGATPKPDALQVAVLGDSITAGSPLWDPDPNVRAGMADRLNDQSQYGYWAERELGGEVRIRNCGVFGERTDQIALRLDDCARGAKVLVIEGGINDIVQGQPPEAAAERLKQMVQRAKRASLVVLLAQILPWNGGYPGAAPQIDRANDLIDAIGRREGVTVLRWYGLMEDPKRPGRMPDVLTLDATHPSVGGYRRMGELLASQLRSSLSRR